MNKLVQYISDDSYKYLVSFLAVIASVGVKWFTANYQNKIREKITMTIKKGDTEVVIKSDDIHKIDIEELVKSIEDKVAKQAKTH